MVDYEKNKQELQRGAFIGALLLLALAGVFMTGCATANTVKKQIAGDLQLIADQPDCETACMLLKDYVKTKLNGL